MSRTGSLLVTIAAIVMARVAVGQQEAQPAEPAVVQNLVPQPSVEADLGSPLLPNPFQKYVSSSGTPPHSPSLSRLSSRTFIPFRPRADQCDFFEERPFGDALRTAMSAQVNRGAEDSQMLYHYDFHPPGTKREAELTPRGQWQLSKWIHRMPITPWPIQIQILEHEPELNQKRRKHVVEALENLDAPDRLVVLGRQKYGSPAGDAVETAESLSQSVKLRGRTLQTSESAKFGQ